MDFKKIEQLIKLVEQSDINGLTVEENDFKIEIQKSGENVRPAVSVPVPAAAPLKEPETPDTAGLKEILSPMTGTFYQSASPGAPALVKTGDTVVKGQPVCVIEAMKTFNEIEADIAGTIEKILAVNAQPVEAGQPLFLIKE